MYTNLRCIASGMKSSHTRAFQCSLARKVVKAAHDLNIIIAFDDSLSPELEQGTSAIIYTTLIHGLANIRHSLLQF